MRGLSLCLLLGPIVGCSGGAGSELAALLPRPPAGWKLQEKGKPAKVDNAGIHAWAVYAPVEAGDIDKVEVTISTRAKDGSDDDLKKLRRLEPFGEGQLMEQIKIAGFPAVQSADFPSKRRKNFLLSVFASKKVTVDIILFPKDEAEYRMGVRPKLARSFAENLDVEKLNALASAEP